MRFNAYLSFFYVFASAERLGELVLLGRMPLDRERDNLGCT